jgi:hypothetical protein
MSEDEAQAQYRQSAEFRSFKQTAVTEAALGRLNTLGQIDPQGVAWAAYDWLQMNEAGLPYLPLIEDNVRDEARFWAETATPAELESYAVAAMDRLSSVNAIFTSRQIKRLIAATWRRMTDDEKAAFRGWIEKDAGKGTE